MKKLVSIILSAVLAVSLVSCGQSGAKGSGTFTATKKVTTTILQLKLF